jgi:hypothetical protein
MQVATPIQQKRYPDTVPKVATCIQPRDHTEPYPIRTLQFAAKALICLYRRVIGEERWLPGFNKAMLSFVLFGTRFIILYTLFDTLALHNMQFIILFASLIAATIALPIAQAGGTDVLSEATSGTDSSLPGNDFLGDGSLPATDLLTADNELMGRSPEVGVSTLQPTGKGFVDSPHRLALAISYQEPRVAPIV